MKDRMKCVEDEESWGFSKVPVACMFLGESDSCFIHTNKEVAGKEPSTFHIHPGFLLNGKTKIRISTKKCNKYIQIHVLLKHHSEIFEQSHIFFQNSMYLICWFKKPDLHLKLNGKTNANLATKRAVALIILVASRFLGDPKYEYTTNEQWKKTGLFKVYGGWNPTRLWVDYNEPL